MKVEVVDATNISFETWPPLESPKEWEITKHCYERSIERWVGFADDKIACMWGLSAYTIMSDQAYIWLFHTPLVEQNKFLFIRHSQRFVQKALERYPVIIGDCVASNAIGQRWLKFLGATFRPVEPGYPLIPFRIEAKNG